MKKIPIIFLVVLFLFGGCTQQNSEKKQSFGIIIHGGTTNIKQTDVSKEDAKILTGVMTKAMQAGYEILNNGGSSVDAVEAAIVIMEDSPLFNAGKGAVFADNGKNELDASIMNGADLNCGAVAGVTVVKNPIKLAKFVMNESRHVMFARDGADSLAKAMNFDIVPNEYFYTEEAYNRMLKVKEEREKEQTDQTTGYNPDNLIIHFGTVGAAALDKSGNLAAGTSTGGLTAKQYGRVGDSPIIGAGTYADNKSCAISCTGHGEFFIRNAVAHDVSALMQYKNYSLKQAADEVILKKLVDQNASGGLIGIDKDGNVTAVGNFTGVRFGYMIDNNPPVVSPYKEN